MKRIIITGLVVVMAILVIGLSIFGCTSSPKQEEVIHLKYATVHTSATTGWDATHLSFANAVQEQSNGRMIIDIYPLFFHIILDLLV